MMNELWFRLLEKGDKGVVGYAVLWWLGVPASVLFVVFLLRGCD